MSCNTSFPVAHCRCASIAQRTKTEISPAALCFVRHGRLTAKRCFLWPSCFFKFFVASLWEHLVELSSLYEDIVAYASSALPGKCWLLDSGIGREPKVGEGSSAQEVVDHSDSRPDLPKCTTDSPTRYIATYYPHATQRTLTVEQHRNAQTHMNSNNTKCGANAALNDTAVNQQTHR